MSGSRVDCGLRMLGTCGSELAREGIGTSAEYWVFEMQHSRASSLPQEGCTISKVAGAWAGLFPAKAGPTESTAFTLLIVPTLRVGMHPGTLRVHSPLKPVPLRDAGF
jgi:hypothetical protein